MWGMSVGTFTVLCPKFISEVAPVEMKGTFGVLSQFMCVFGILAESLMCLPVPSPLTGSSSFFYPTGSPECTT